ncbi:MAG: alpha/beta hydrolase [Deltaproteobacteria bacterium]|nr:alpha/beta hydrolase [Deltaproteobacteria bacterium]
MNAAGLVDQPLTVRGARAVVRRRVGQGVPLVLVPGCGRDHHDFDRLLDALEGADVIVPALPGRAGVPGAPPADAAEAARYVLDVLDACRVTRAVVGGHSYGGAIAIEAALAEPDRVAGLALLSTGARLRVAPAMIEAVAASGDQVALADWRACDRFDRLGDVARLRGPAAVVVGSDDPLTPVRYARFLSERLASAQLSIIDGAGHEAPSTHPVEVAAALRGLLESVAAQRRRGTSC